MIRGKVRNHVPTNIESSWNANIHNRFDIEVRDAKTNQLKQKAQAFNVICNNFWTNLTTGVSYIVYSNGSGTPSVSDTTTFGTWRAVSATTEPAQTDIKTGISYMTRRIVLDEQTAVGMTITEVGLAYSSSSGSLCTHAMIQDMNGNQISIRKTSTDILTIYATVYVHWVPSGQNGITLIPPLNGSSGDTRNFLDFALGAGINTEYEYVCAGPYVVESSLGGQGSRSWNAATKTLTYTFERLGANECNVTGGFGWLAYSSICIIDLRDEYKILSESIGTGDGSTVAFSTKFDMPTNAVVYVDGVAMTSGVTVSPYPVRSTAMSYMLLMQDTLHDNKPCFYTGMSTNVDPNNPRYLYNPLHELGVGKFTSNSNQASYLRFAFSDDLTNWSPDYKVDVTIPDEYRHRKYIRLKCSHNSGAGVRYTYATFASGVSSKNVVFDIPPAAGSAITIDYVTPYLPKDANHVYDLSMTVQFGEYTGN